MPALREPIGEELDLEYLKPWLDTLRSSKVNSDSSFSFYPKIPSAMITNQWQKAFHFVSLRLHIHFVGTMKMKHNETKCIWTPSAHYGQLASVVSTYSRDPSSIVRIGEKCWWLVVMRIDCVASDESIFKYDVVEDQNHYRGKNENANVVGRWGWGWKSHCSFPFEAQARARAKDVAPKKKSPSSHWFVTEEAEQKGKNHRSSPQARDEAPAAPSRLGLGLGTRHLQQCHIASFKRKSRGGNWFETEEIAAPKKKRGRAICARRKNFLPHHHDNGGDDDCWEEIVLKASIAAYWLRSRWKDIGGRWVLHWM